MKFSPVASIYGLSEPGPQTDRAHEMVKAVYRAAVEGETFGGVGATGRSPLHFILPANRR